MDISYVSHSYEEACALRQDCVDGHCGGEHECAGDPPAAAGRFDDLAVCAGADRRTAAPAST